ncbi:MULTISPECIES: Flp family type IVb pilin [Pseudomonas]|uniref:Flp family type IVb pilin n=2 Tax=Pseudomonas TaxID=286 RepID=A0ABS6RQD4_9PSED|nr:MULTISPECIES: Flp family type IVb pilin [Pseudomonas]MBR7195810.1 Flp family type IVb pilin [Pseudomonas sp. 14A]MBV4547816.1 Flp family type IVb pilin [Pseudomonas triticicola]MEB2856431.1 Flp family type IVb pilin [Pseudomonas atacamensis]PYB94099.1 Flp family type IVb pilin [Pseudomonas koreensis]
MTFDYVIAKARAFARSEEGASAIEYAIVVAMVAVVVVVFVTPIGAKVLAIFNSVLTSLGGTAQVRPTT